MGQIVPLLKKQEEETWFPVHPPLHSVGTSSYAVMPPVFGIGTPTMIEHIWKCSQKQNWGNVSWLVLDPVKLTSALINTSVITFSSDI